MYEEINRKGDFFVSKTVLEWKDYQQYLENFVGRWRAKVDEKRILLIRMVFMNPFIEGDGDGKNYVDGFVREVQKVLRN